MRARLSITPLPASGVRILAVAVVGLTLASAAAVRAQEPNTPAPAGFAVGANLVFQAFSGEDFESFDDGFGGLVTVRYTTPSGFQLLGGVGYSVHNVASGPGTMRFLELLVEPRYVLQLIDSERIVLVIAGRSAFVRQTLRHADLEAGASGLLLGGSVGGIYDLRNLLAVEFALFFGGLWTDGVTAVVEGEKSGSGNVTSLQLGIVWSFPG